MKMYRSLLIVCLLLAATASRSHRLGESYLFLDIYQHAIEGRLEITLTDLDLALQLDQDTDGKISPDELHAKIDLLRSYLAPRVKLSAAGESLPLSYTAPEIMYTSQGKFAVIYFTIEHLNPMPQQLDVFYSVLFEADPDHLGLLLIESNQITGVVNTPEDVELVFSPGNTRQKLDLHASSLAGTFRALIKSLSRSSSD